MRNNFYSSNKGRVRRPHSFTHYWKNKSDDDGFTENQVWSHYAENYQKRWERVHSK